MLHKTLVPENTQELFRESSPEGVELLYYRFNKEAFLRKVLRKTGITKPSKTVDHKFHLLSQKDSLDQVESMWLSTSAWLPPDQMSCLLDRMGNLKWVYVQSTGVEHLNLLDFRKRGVMVSNTGDLNSKRVAEMALACILSHLKRLPEHFANQSRKNWCSLISEDFSDNTVGIVGTGNIGNEVAKMCRALGMHVVGASRRPGRFDLNNSPFHQLVNFEDNLEALFAQADQIVLTLPLNPETRGLVGARLLAHMKEDAALINVCRGQIVDELALCNALKMSKLRAAYIDRPANLPPSKSDILYRTKGVFLTHYSAANSPKSLKFAHDQFLENLSLLIESGVPPDRVV